MNGCTAAGYGRLPMGCSPPPPCGPVMLKSAARARHKLAEGAILPPKSKGGTERIAVYSAIND